MAEIKPQDIDNLAQSRKWFLPKKDSKTYAAIQSYLSGSTSLEDAVTQISTPIDESLSISANLDEDELEGLWWDLWHSIFHSSRRISYHDEASHAKLVSLIKALKSHPDPKPSAARDPVWPALPWFGAAARAAYNDAPLDDLDSPNSTTIATEAAAWASLNFFLANVTQAGIQDFVLYFAVWALRAALEDEISAETEPHKFDARVPAAAAWVVYAGKDLYRREVDLTPTGNGGSPGRGGPLWSGKAELSKARWAFWKERFGAVKDAEGVQEATKLAAKEAVEAMERAENY